ncbi:Gfo/Idh/MocA family oxidoreductase [Microbispora sp. H13382]|uniref:Gfo/Idh/MocA family protein n=1 Tax=Microbispora sp. H13382 TaxID=2729112 RepID=UPI0016043C42|nr:Gfo/Idh/MocA family oxidoreductase [Microbispora sp. H13382]
MGLGVAAQVVYLPLLAKRRDIFQVSAVCDLDGDHAETLGRELGVRSYDRAMAMLEAGGFDALIVLTPGSHGPLVKAALACGCWVLCEKPLAYSRAELRASPATRG